MDPTRLTASEQMRAMERGEVSSRELTAAHLERVASHPRYNAVITTARAGAMAAATAADERRAGERSGGGLLGLPVTVKDSLETAGLRTTCGAVELADHVPDRDADAVARLRTAGAVILGKTNTPPMCQDLQTSNPLFGATPNPHDPHRTAGGSSGGPAAAVAAHLSPVDLGSDLAGSLRLPAHYCGVYGLRPSGGIVPTRGHIPRPPGWLTSSDMLTLGPLARGAADLDLALDVLVGPSPEDSAAWRLHLPPAPHRRLGEYRVGIWADDPYCRVDTQTRALLERVARVLEAAGAHLDRTTRPVDMAASDGLFQTLLFSGTSPSADQAAFAAEIAAAEREHLDTSPHAAFLRSRTLRHRDWLMANEERQRLRARWAHYFRTVDILLTPAAPTPAVPAQSDTPVPQRYITVDGERRGYWEQSTWLNLAGVAHLPAVTLPVGHSTEGLPLGLQLIGPYLADRTLTHVAHLLSQTDGLASAES